MVSAFLIVVGVVVAALLLIAVLMVYTYFGHEDDKDEAILPKVVVIFSLFAAIGTVLILPYDCANAQSKGGLDMATLWQVCYIVIGVLITAVIPLAFFYYEGDDTDDDGNESDTARIGHAIKMTLLFIGIIITILFLMWNFLGTTDIPVTHYQVYGGRSCTPAVLRQNSVGNTATQMCGLLEVSYKDANGIIKQGTITRTNMQTFRGSNPSNFACSSVPGCVVIPKSFWNFQVTLPIYIMAMLSFLGYFFFACFTGIGLMALPFDLIYDFVNRPIPMSATEYSKKNNEIGQRAAKLLEIGSEMLANHEGGKKAKNTKIRLTGSSQNKFELAVYQLKKEWKILDVSHRLKGGNPLWPFFLLLVGIFGISLSITWLIHIGIFMTPDIPFTPFLNNFFVTMQDAIEGFPLFGIVTFCIYCLWLLWCCVKGAFRFGLRIPFCFKIYPMEVGNTYLSGFLANTWIICLCSLPCVQFCVEAFPIYARSSSANVLLGSQVKYLKFFRWFWVYPIFKCVVLAFAAITAAILTINPTDRNAEIEEELKRMNEDDEDLNV